MSIDASQRMLRLLKLLAIIAGMTVALFVGAISIFLWLAPGSSADEVARVSSPEGDIEAVLVETNGGATTSFGYEIFVVPNGVKKRSSRAAHLYAAVRNSSAYGVNLRWLSASELLIEYQKADSSEVDQPSVVVAGRTVRVVLRPGVTDPNAPPGGMLYNKRRMSIVTHRTSLKAAQALGSPAA